MAERLDIDDLSLFVQSGPNARFRLTRRFRLGSR
jgi:hypothetical protein